MRASSDMVMVSSSGASVASWLIHERLVMRGSDGPVALRAPNFWQRQLLRGLNSDVTWLLEVRGPVVLQSTLLAISKWLLEVWIYWDFRPQCWVSRSLPQVSALSRQPCASDLARLLEVTRLAAVVLQSTCANGAAVVMQSTY